MKYFLLNVVEQNCNPVTTNSTLDLKITPVNHLNTQSINQASTSTSMHPLTTHSIESFQSINLSMNKLYTSTSCLYNQSISQSISHVYKRILLHKNQSIKNPSQSINHPINQSPTSTNGYPETTHSSFILSPSLASQFLRGWENVGLTGCLWTVSWMGNWPSMVTRHDVFVSPAMFRAVTV